MRKLQINFSGGETSAFMTYALINGGLAARRGYTEVCVVFANTGEEWEQTLVFVDRCARAFNWNVIWVEAVQQHGKRASPMAKVVTFTTASREGQPFEDMIVKHGIPNPKFKHCTRELKRRPIDALMRDMSWCDFDRAVGIRIDEVDRVSPTAKAQRLVYPLVEWLPTTKPQINDWWARQPFRLELKGYQGNCKWCWKKSLRKHMTIMRETPDAFDFPRRMEEAYATVGPEWRLRTPEPEYRRRFFRGGRSVEDLKAEFAALPANFQWADDEALVREPFDPILDTGADCEESCEPYGATTEPDSVLDDDAWLEAATR